MKICEIRAAGLQGATPEGGWSSELEQQDCVHTLIAVLTDEGVTGIGSVFPNCDLFFKANPHFSRLPPIDLYRCQQWRPAAVAADPHNSQADPWQP